MRAIRFAILGLLALSGCDDDEACTIGSAEGCDDGQVCESFPGDVPRCTTPVFVEGRVFDLTTDLGIAGARVVALDANGGARSGVTFSEADGAYSLQVSIPRNEAGEPMSEGITLRVDAADYEKFPNPPREALPINLGAAVLMDSRYVVQDTRTDVGLLPQPGEGESISGTVEAEEPGGVLVVAEQGGVAVSTSITAADGAFTLYNVPVGSTVLTAFRAGLYAGPQTVDQVAGGLTGVILTGTTEGLGTINGSVTFVNPGSGTTSVILVVESTFNDVTGRGEAPAGLRAYPVMNEFTIPDVPPGNYVVLAAFENDGFVRDPDTTQGGTATLHITVAAGQTLTPEAFKVTGAMDVISPGAEAQETVTAPPDLVWDQDDGEAGYDLVLFDSYGTIVHQDTTIPPGDGNNPITYSLAGRTLSEGGALVPGTVYQFRAFSKDGSTPAVRLSATEDLRGIFLFDPAAP